MKTSRAQKQLRSILAQRIEQMPYLARSILAADLQARGAASSADLANRLGCSTREVYTSRLRAQDALCEQIRVSGERLAWFGLLHAAGYKVSFQEPSLDELAAESAELSRRVRDDRQVWIGSGVGASKDPVTEHTTAGLEAVKSEMAQKGREGRVDVAACAASKCVAVLSDALRAAGFRDAHTATA